MTLEKDFKKLSSMFKIHVAYPTKSFIAGLQPIHCQNVEANPRGFSIHLGL